MCLLCHYSDLRRETGLDCILFTEETMQRVGVKDGVDNQLFCVVSAHHVLMCALQHSDLHQHWPWHEGHDLTLYITLNTNQMGKDDISFLILTEQFHCIVIHNLMPKVTIQLSTVYTCEIADSSELAIKSEFPLYLHFLPTTRGPNGRKGKYCAQIEKNMY